MLSSTPVVNVLFVVLLVLVISSGNDDVQFHVHAKKNQVYLNCTTRKELFVPVAAFLLNNVSLANISPSNGTCYIGQRKCQQHECECGMRNFIYRQTLSLNDTQLIFTCELLFNEKRGGMNRHVTVQASVLHNTSGKLLQN